ncbi:MAG TPA: Ppx/GppA family phosphatase [Thermohalobaculum sp.]|nr:Ppx/GppA family phosphatase [Thermohalobaculum sp.]
MRSPAERQGTFFPGQPPSFPGLRTAADRIGVIDVGSNTVRMVVFEGGNRSPAMLFNEKVMCALGARLAETGALDPEGKARAIATLKRFAAIAPALHVGALAGVATAAVRDASDGAAFRDQVETETGIRLEILSGVTEARLAAQGVVFGNPRASGVVVDLGGASMELCRVENGHAGQGLTTPLGPLRLQAPGVGARAVAAEIKARVRTLADAFRIAGGRLYLVGGAWRALGRAHMERTGYPLRVLHEYGMTIEQALEHADWAAATAPAKIAALPGVPSSRAPVLPLAGRLLRSLIEHLEPGDAMISGFGLREGVCLENMPPALRARDPLMAAAEKQEVLRARAPGSGAELADWALQIMPALDPGEERLVRASAMLADVNWRTNPDYRITGCWETVTRTALTDLGHSGRVFMGSILSARYKRSRQAGQNAKFPGLLSEDRQFRAFCYGTAFRLGTAISGSTPGALPDCGVIRTADRLDLEFRGKAADLLGEEVEKRFGRLLRALRVSGSIAAAPDR